jgi:hypothetical protein
VTAVVTIGRRCLLTYRGTNSHGPLYKRDVPLPHYRHRPEVCDVDARHSQQSHHSLIRNPPTMLDDFSIVTTSGIVLWRRSYAPVSSNLVNSLINDVFVEERQKSAAQETALNPPYKKDKYTLKWTAAKDVGLVFVVGKSACDRISTSLHIDICLCRPYTKVFFTCLGLTTC